MISGNLNLIFGKLILIWCGNEVISTHIHTHTHTHTHTYIYIYIYIFFKEKNKDRLENITDKKTFIGLTSTK